MSSPLRKSLAQSDSPLARVIIIQCPSCQTKFAVDRTIVSEVDAPRFHCSRCDNVFSQGDQLALVTPEWESTAEAVTEPSESEELDILSTLENTNEPTDQELSESALAGGIPERDSTLTSTEEAPQWSLLNDEIEIPELIEGATEKREQLTAIDTVDSEEKPILKFTGGQVEMPLSMQNEEPKVASVELLPPPVSNATGASWGIARSLIGNGGGDRVLDHPAANVTIGKSPEDRVPQENIERWTQTTLGVDELRRPATGVFARYGGLVAIGGPIIGFLFILGVLAIGIASNKGIADTVSGLLNPGAPRVAASGLRVNNLQFKRVALDNGEIVPVITGRLDNGSNERYRQVMLEGLLFDRKGSVVTTSRVNAASTLSKTRIKSLSSDVIKAYQSGQIVKRFDLKPGAAQEFSVAMMDGVTAPNNGITPRFYSVRIHSVR